MILRLLELKVGSKNKYIDCNNLTDSYKVYKSEAKGKYDISYKDYVNICYETNKAIVKLLLEGSAFKMPYRLGDLSVRRRKVNYNNLKIDFAEFNRTGKKLKILNDHTDGWYFRFTWDKSLTVTPNKFYYSFVPTRGLTRELVRLLKSGERIKTDFFE